MITVIKVPNNYNYGSRFTKARPKACRYAVAATVRYWGPKERKDRTSSRATIDREMGLCASQEPLEVEPEGFVTDRRITNAHTNAVGGAATRTLNHWTCFMVLSFFLTTCKFTPHD